MIGGGTPVDRTLTMATAPKRLFADHGRVVHFNVTEHPTAAREGLRRSFRDPQHVLSERAVNPVSFKPLDRIAGAIYIFSMHKTTIYLDDPLYRRIRRLARASGRTQASIIREALARYTTGANPRPRSIGLGSSGAGDLSERAEELLNGMGEDE